MERLERGLKLFHPWAGDVVNGKLNYLIRPIRIREEIMGRVAVIATPGIDRVWHKKADKEKIREVKNKLGAIGSVDIKNCIEVSPSKTKEEIIKLAGKDYWKYYPKYLIPKYTRTGKVYIWVLDQAKEWEESVPMTGGGILWSKIDLEDK